MFSGPQNPSIQASQSTPDVGDDTSSDELLAVLLASGKTYSQTAALARCSLEVVRQRMQESAFRLRVSQLRGETVERVLGRLTDASTKAVDTLVAGLRSCKPADRRAAAEAILQKLVQLRGTIELEERLAALEQAGEVKVQ